MGLAILEVAPPASRNRSPAKGTRRAALARHRSKRSLEAELGRMLQAAGVPKPIPGDRARATATILFPTLRTRDEGNYRGELEKALGDALCPHATKEELELGIPPAPGYLTDDDPDRFTFGAVTFGQTDLSEWRAADGKTIRRRRPAVCIIRLVWGEDLVAELERELAELRERAA